MCLGNQCILLIINSFLNIFFVLMLGVGTLPDMIILNSSQPKLPENLQSRECPRQRWRVPKRPYRHPFIGTSLGFAEKTKALKSMI